MSEVLYPEDQEFDNLVVASLNMDEEEAKAFRLAINNVTYEQMFKPLWRRHEEFKQHTLIVEGLLFLMWAFLMVYVVPRVW